MSDAARAVAFGYVLGAVVTLYLTAVLLEFYSPRQIIVSNVKREVSEK